MYCPFPTCETDRRLVLKMLSRETLENVFFSKAFLSFAACKDSLISKNLENVNGRINIAGANIFLYVAGWEGNSSHKSAIQGRIFVAQSIAKNCFLISSCHQILFYPNFLHIFVGKVGYNSKSLCTILSFMYCLILFVICL